MTDSANRIQAALDDRYPIERELGSGGMATVYLARDVKHGRQVAIKVLRSDLAASLGADRFVQEIEIAAKLTHPHILPLFDSGEAEGFLYYVMPYVEGESLRDLLSREATLSLTEVVRITAQVASALTYAHERGVIHRDIKPENILLAGDQAVVADFGIARAVELAGSERLTQTGLAIGTPAYMSPEQSFGVEVGTTADVYALGCVVFEMLTGGTPYQGPAPQAILAKHAAEDVPSLREGTPEVPVTVERAVHRALAKAPTDRFPTAVGFAEALTVAITEEAQAAEAQRVRRRRRRQGLVAAVTMAALGLGGWWFAGTLGPTAIETLAVLPASNMTRDSAHSLFVDGVHEAITTELRRAGLSVFGRQSVLQYRETEKPIRQIAQELGVDGLIQPTVGRDGDSVFVDVSLYGGQSDLPLWTSSFDDEMQSVLGLYRDISRRIADEIGAVLTSTAEARLSERPIIDPQVLEAVQAGESHLGRFTPQDFTRALEYFESALAIDPSYAPAHLGVAKVWGYRGQASVISSAEARTNREGPLARALQLDPQLASAQFFRAGVLVWADWDLEAGEAAFQEALRLDPDDAQTQVFYGHLSMILGRPDEAVRRGELAVRLDPLDPFVVGLYGTILAFVGRSEEAIEVIQDVLAKYPGAAFGEGGLVAALHAAGRFDEEFQLMRTRFARENQAAVAALDRGLAEGGYTGAWRAVADMLAESRRGRLSGAMAVSEYYLKAGEVDKAIDWLAIALEQRDQNAPYIGVLPLFWDLHDDPRFQQLARDVGVPLWKPDGV